jgi:type IV pilus assembly protein PilM
MFDFLTIEPESFGLDFSDLSLKIAKLERRGKFLTLASWGEIELEPGIIKSGEIKNKEALVLAIKELLRKVKGKKLRTNNVIAALPEQKSFFQKIRMPKMNEEELKTAVPFEAENYLPLPIKDVYLDFTVLAGGPSNVGVEIPPARSKTAGQPIFEGEDILIAAFPKKVVDSYLFCLKKSGLAARALEVESQSIVRALIKNETSPFPLFIIDFGRSTTSLIFFFGHSLLYTSSIAISSQNITEAISRAFKVDLTQAEKLKLKYGFDLEFNFVRSPLKPQKSKQNGSKKNLFQERKESKKVFEATKPVLIDLIGEIRKYFKYCQTHIYSLGNLSESGKIKKIILCGRGSALKGLTDFLALELKIPVEIGNPWINILPESLKEVPGMSYEESLGYATALGLALRGVKNN